MPGAWPDTVRLTGHAGPVTRPGARVQTYRGGLVLNTLAPGTKGAPDGSPWSVSDEPVLGARRASRARTDDPSAHGGPEPARWPDSDACVHSSTSRRASPSRRRTRFGRAARALNGWLISIVCLCAGGGLSHEQAGGGSPRLLSATVRERRRGRPLCSARRRRAHDRVGDDAVVQSDSVTGRGSCGPPQEGRRPHLARGRLWTTTRSDAQRRPRRPDESS
jgi:hypothetical protein